jgi:hypothetical protein
MVIVKPPPAFETLDTTGTPVAGGHIKCAGERVVDVWEHWSMPVYFGTCACDTNGCGSCNPLHFADVSIPCLHLD